LFYPDGLAEIVFVKFLHYTIIGFFCFHSSFWMQDSEDSELVC
jgi:hypothetical protein